MGHGLVSLVHLTTACTFTKKYNPWFFYSEVVPKKYCYFTRAAAETGQGTPKDLYQVQQTWKFFFLMYN